MFRIFLPKLEVIIEGCPKSGIPAIDFRRQAGLPESPTNVIKLLVDLTSEAAVRQFAQFANSDADIRYDDAGYGFYDSLSSPDLAGSPDNDCRRSRHHVSPVVLRTCLQDAENGIAGLLGELAADKAGVARLAKAEAEVLGLARPDESFLETYWGAKVPEGLKLPKGFRVIR